MLCAAKETIKSVTIESLIELLIYNWILYLKYFTYIIGQTHIASELALTIMT